MYNPFRSQPQQISQLLPFPLSPPFKITLLKVDRFVPFIIGYPFEIVGTFSGPRSDYRRLPCGTIYLL